MTRLIVKPSTLNGQISIPTSKSHTMRAILFAAMGKGKSLIAHYLASPDTNAMIHACRLIGATINQSPGQLEVIGVNGRISYNSGVIHAGNSGIILRFLSALGGLSLNPVVITGDESIRNQRPMHSLLNGLRQLGVSAISMRGNDFAPVIIQGPIQYDYARINGEDSQFVSALLIASAFAGHPIEIEVENPGEKPWVEMTLDWFNRLGIFCTHQNFQNYRLQGESSYQGFAYQVPGDFSSAAFPIAAALITRSELTLKNLNMDDSQGDKKLISVFKKMGALIDYRESDQSLQIKKSGSLIGIDVDVNDLIDALPILAVVACFAEGKTILRNAGAARYKECDRIHVMCKELSKMGARIIETRDGLIISHSTLHGQNLFSHHDHRVAMALAVGGLGASGVTGIESVDCLTKTYSTFIRDFNILGAEFKLTV